ncbi:nucleolin-like [Hypomesus transpacificus]|uniref:nucleolin-like n=1 Tax=Hypomesus transpacificus TaxID=137520 RepID=UPI001F084859|nr:nucleolin-like [Hypomesus transpacificus]
MAESSKATANTRASRTTTVKNASEENDIDVQAVCPSPRSEDATPTADVQADSENEVTAGKGSVEEQSDPTPAAAAAAAASESTASVTVTWEPETEMADDETHGDQEEDQSDQDENEKVVAVKSGKRKPESTVDASPSKKIKRLNDGFCLFVGSLNTSKTYDEVKDSLANYFSAQSILVQDIRLDSSRKFAYIDLPTEEDLSKALILNGEKILDKPMRIDKAKVKEIIAKAKHACTLFVKEIPYSATKEELKIVFDEAVDIRFLGGGDGPNKGIAFVDFKTEFIAEKVLKAKQGTDVGGRAIIIDFLGEKSAQMSKQVPAEATPTNTLMVKNLSYKVKEDSLKKVFKKAVSVKIPKMHGKRRGFALIKFESEDDARDAIQSLQSTEINGRAIRIEFDKFIQVHEGEKVLSKTLVIRGLAKETSKETLESAFEGAIGARIVTSNNVSRGFGFVDFENPEACKAAKDAMEDCEIDGSKVAIDYAVVTRGAVRGGFRGQPKGRGAAGRGGIRGRRGGPGGGRGGDSGTKLKSGKPQKKKVQV